MDRTTLFADILLPLPLDGYFTYRVPQALNEQIQPGIRVVVPFGPKKVYSGLIRRIHQQPPAKFEAKYIYSIVDQIPLVFEGQFRFWEWIASYYLCTTGEVMNTALPPAMKLASETTISFNPEYEGLPEDLPEKEYKIANALENQKNLTVSEIMKITGIAKVFPIIGSLLDKRIIVLKEELDNPYREKTEKFLRLTHQYDAEDKLKEAFDLLEKKAPKQLEVLISFIKLSERYVSNPPKQVPLDSIRKKLKSPTQAVNALVDKNILEVYRQKVSRFDHQRKSDKEIELNEFQLHTQKQITEQWKQTDCVLLHGVTSSGKTEIYIKLMEDVMEKGGQVLYLLPEIALTTQIIRRIQKHFGEKAGVYHSKFNHLERTEVWNNLALGGVESLQSKIRYQLVTGARSALFLPFQNLQLIIIDEEHETSYKQFDPAPRYNARDAAIYLARQFGAKVLLGSATPSIESVYNARKGKYGFVELKRRYGGMQLPEIMTADIKKETIRKQMKSHLSKLLFDEINIALENKKQVILFQNRRGFSPRMECEQCNNIPSCTQCDVSLVYHKKINKLKCHYCGYSVTPPVKCPSCGNSDIKLKGFGTEKIEEELPLVFPEAKVKRMDLDTTRSKNAYQNIFSDFDEKKIDILVGTQMVSKGLDFENVSVVGILNADNMLNWPDFRAHERAFQMMAQVSGRAGRKHDRGKVIIQSFNPWHNIIRHVIDNDYEAMYKQQILERKNFLYPPFIRLIELTVSHSDYDKVNKASWWLANEIKSIVSKQMVLGPEFPLIARIKAQFLKSIIVKLPRNKEMENKKMAIRQKIEDMKSGKDFKPVRVKINVDPY